MPGVTSISSQPLRHIPPTYHLKAPSGWINDPCAPGYDAVTGTYHLFYQWNPKSCDWGDITWGHFTSQDGVFWKHNGHDPVLKPTLSYDKEGIFTGCFYPTGLQGEESQLSIIYSSIEKLPIHWSLPYSHSCAGLSAAVSNDGGQSWQKSDLNPILRGEPQDLTVTGFRDPYLAEWPALDDLRGEASLYGVVSGGVLNHGPTVFLYAVAPTDLSSWRYLGQLVDVPVGSCSVGRWGADLGINWECVNFMTLRNGSEECQVLTLGSEGGRRRGCSDDGEDEQGVQLPVWVAGGLETTPKGVQLEHRFSGMLDHGCFYAPNTYQHPETKKRIMWGWIKEEELTLARRELKGWTGYLSVPRELFLFSAKNVIGTLRTPLNEIESIDVVSAKSTSSLKRRTKKVKTLGIRPLSDLRALRRSKAATWSHLGGQSGTGQLTDSASTNWELEAVVNIQRNQGRVGFFIQHNEDLSQRTSIFFSLDEEEIVVDRSLSNFEPDVQKHDVSGAFTLFMYDEDCSDSLEKLHLRVFCDGDVLEIFANDRFALSTVAYSGGQLYSGISWFVEGQDLGSVQFESIRLWENLAKVTRFSSE